MKPRAAGPRGQALLEWVLVLSLVAVACFVPAPGGRSLAALLVQAFDHLLATELTLLSLPVP